MYLFIYFIIFYFNIIILIMYLFIYLFINSRVSIGVRKLMYFNPILIQSPNFVWLTQPNCVVHTNSY